MPSLTRLPVLIRWRTTRSLTRTVRHRSPMRARARCAWTRLAVADLKRVTSGGSRLGNALPPITTASLIWHRRVLARPYQSRPNRSARPHTHRGRECRARVRSGYNHKGFRFGGRRGRNGDLVGGERRRKGGGVCHNYFCDENRPIYRVAILHVTRYQLMSWMVATGVGPTPMSQSCAIEEDATVLP
jgi:hypothetical protein